MPKTPALGAREEWQNISMPTHSKHRPVIKLRKLMLQALITSAVFVVVVVVVAAVVAACSKLLIASQFVHVCPFFQAAHVASGWGLVPENFQTNEVDAASASFNSPSRCSSTPLFATVVGAARKFASCCRPLSDMLVSNAFASVETFVMYKNATC